jgi:hypothetical protein
MHWHGNKPAPDNFSYSAAINEKIFFIPFAGSRIYHLRGLDPDDDPLTFGLRDQVGNEIFHIENVGKNEADVFLKKELDREVMQ